VNKLRKSAAAALTLPLLLFASGARADLIEVSITVDNSFAVFTGDYYGATTYAGHDTDGYWGTPENFFFDLSSNQFIYVVTVSDLSAYQGFLGKFTNQTTGYTFYSDDPQWQVTATGQRNGSLPYYGAPFSQSEVGTLSGQIALANAGTNPSGGWQNFTAGGANGSAPWGYFPTIGPEANWAWYAGGNCDPINPTVGGCDAGEWLIFRIGVAATPENPVPVPPTVSVPEPGTLLLLASGLLGIGVARRRRHEMLR
jgi:hypothetical protein